MTGHLTGRVSGANLTVSFNALKVIYMFGTWEQE